MADQTEKWAKMIAGFWIRVVADAIDMAILWAFALILGFVFEDWFLRLGENGVWFGLLRQLKILIILDLFCDIIYFSFRNKMKTRIGQIAATLAVTAETLRSWEKN